MGTELVAIYKLKVNKISDVITNRKGEKVQIRTITFDSGDVTLTIKGKPWALYDFSVGDSVEVRISREESEKESK